MGLPIFCCSADGLRARHDSDLDLAVICQEPELNSQMRTKCWRTYRAALGGLGCGIDLLLQGQVDAATLSESRWHVMKEAMKLLKCWNVLADGEPPRSHELDLLAREANLNLANLLLDIQPLCGGSALSDRRLQTSLRSSEGS